MEVRFTVPGEPVPKERPRFATRGRSGKALAVPRVYTPPTTEEYEKRVRLVAQAARPTGWPMRCDYRVAITVYRAARGDWDNYAKAIMDALNPRRAKGGRRPRPAVPGVLWSDDARSSGGTVSTEPAEGNPRVEVSVMAFPVRCKLKGCGGQTTLYPDEQGRCETCAAKAAARRVR